jgi:hypothetical protein
MNSSTETYNIFSLKEILEQVSGTVLEYLRKKVLRKISVSVAKSI